MTTLAPSQPVAVESRRAFRTARQIAARSQLALPFEFSPVDMRGTTRAFASSIALTALSVAPSIALTAFSVNLATSPSVIAHSMGGIVVTRAFHQLVRQGWARGESTDQDEPVLVYEPSGESVETT